MRIDDVARTLGLSTRAVYRRIDALNGKLDGYLKRGRNNDLIFNGEALAILQRVEDVRKSAGIPIRQAVVRVLDELNGNGVEPLREGAENSALVEVLKTQVEVLREELEHLRRENEWLRGRVDELTPLALPRPRRRWLAWLRPARGRSV